MSITENSFIVTDILNGDSRFGVTSVLFGPDGNLYSADITGTIYRYDIDPDTGLATSVTAIFESEGAQILGVKFDPSDDNALWISYATRGERHSGTISKIDLTTGEETEYITGLPNGADLEHQVNGIDFGPDGKLYISVGGTRSLGGDGTWSEPETPLSAAVVVADVRNDPRFDDGPIDVTAEADGSGYDPFADDAPVWLYATGLRNCYDIEWSEIDGEFILVGGINMNDRAPGQSLTPDDPDTEANEAIYSRPEHESVVIIKEGFYYGHPNPSRGQYILNGGNPTEDVDPFEIPEYEVGTLPEDGFDPSLFLNVADLFDGFSPNGTETYVNGEILQANFNGGEGIHVFAYVDDALVYNGALLNQRGDQIFFDAPLDVAVDPATGRIYVANFGEGQSNPSNGGIFLLDPTGEVVVGTGGSSGSDSETLLIEAETLIQSGFVSTAVVDASAGAAAILSQSGDTGSIFIDFREDFGLYNIEIGYFDDNGGLASFELQIGDQVYTWIADADLGSGQSVDTAASFTLTGIELGAGDGVTIRGVADGTDLAALDFIEFTALNTAPIPIVDSLDRTVATGETLTVDLSRYFQDADGDLLTFVFDEATPPGVQISGSFLTYSPQVGEEGVHTYSILADDGEDQSAAIPITITVTEPGQLPVSAPTDIDDTPNTILENAIGGTLVGITAEAIEPNSADMVTGYTLSDNRFVIDVDGIVSVADGALFDAETEALISLGITASSSDGSTGQTLFDIAIGDVNESPIGAVSDVDSADNAITDMAIAGTLVGLTASATDPDLADMVASYTVDDARFVIDASGVVTVADGALFDAAAEAVIPLLITAISTDGSTSQQAFNILVTEIADAPVGAVVDINGAANTLTEGALAGVSVGITAEAVDPTEGDSVSYSVDDARFVIDTSGVVTIANGAVFDAAGESLITLNVTATSTDGST
ncbi:MAG: hypothetical protein CME88_12520, partial [Hirschia sp.]|nr:hypothetical protein [Hirschia sp.]